MTQSALLWIYVNDGSRSMIDAFDFSSFFQQSELINLAVLNGRQVSQPLKVFIVSEAGQIADVTLHSSCSSKDDSALKVGNMLYEEADGVAVNQ